MFNLSTETEKRFNQLEKIIEKGMTHFVEVGTALSIIRNEKLYKLLFQTFEEYYKERWGFAKSQAYRLMDAAKVNQNLSPIGEISPPQKESQSRSLTNLPPEQQKEAWKKAVETAPKGKVTAKHVENVVEGLAMARPEENIVGGEVEENEEPEDTTTLKKLKQYWEIADNYEKEIFLDWLKSRKEI